MKHKPTFLTVRQLSELNPVFSESSIRWYIFNSSKNGLDDLNVIKRIGRKLLIDEGKFFEWINTYSKTTNCI